MSYKQPVRVPFKHGPPPPKMLRMGPGLQDLVAGVLIAAAILLFCVGFADWTMRRHPPFPDRDEWGPCVWSGAMAPACYRRCGQDPATLEWCSP